MLTHAAWYCIVRYYAASWIRCGVIPHRTAPQRIRCEWTLITSVCTSARGVQQSKGSTSDQLSRFYAQTPLARFVKTNRTNEVRAVLLSAAVCLQFCEPVGLRWIRDNDVEGNRLTGRADFNLSIVNYRPFLTVAFINCVLMSTM